MKPSTVSQDERNCIGTILFDPHDALERIRTILGPGDFISPMCRHVYQQAIDWDDAEVELDGGILIDLAARFEPQWRDTLLVILQDSPTSGTAGYYARKVKEASINRRLMDGPDLGTLRGLEAELEDLKAPALPTPDRSASSIARYVLDHPIVGGIDPGWECLGNAVRRVWKTHLWVIGGYTSVGKSAFTIATILRICERTPTAKILVCSTEMARHTYAARMLANLSGISALTIQLGELGPYAKDNVSKAQRVLESYQITLRDDLYTLPAIQSAIKQTSPDIVVLDFAQAVRVPNVRSVYERMVEVAMACQEIPKRHNLTMIALSQTDNASVRDKTPELIATKGGGELAAAADLVIWLEHVKETDYLKVMIRKNRHGPTGGRYFEYVGNYTRFEEKAVNFRTD